MVISDIFKTTWFIGSENDTVRCKMEKISTAVFFDEQTSTILINTIKLQLSWHNTPYSKLNILYILSNTQLWLEFMSPSFTILQNSCRGCVDKIYALACSVPTGVCSLGWSFMYFIQVFHMCPRYFSNKDIQRCRDCLFVYIICVIIDIDFNFITNAAVCHCMMKSYDIVL